MNDISDLLRNPLWDFRHFLTIGPPCSCGSTENEEAWHLNRQQNFCGSIHIHKVANVALESPAEKVAGSLTTCQGASKLRLNEICCSNSTNISSIFRMAHGFISALLSLKCYSQWSKISHHSPKKGRAPNPEEFLLTHPDSRAASPLQTEPWVWPAAHGCTQTPFILRLG